jgi:glutathione synthase/RimK-type ligase-like ATP-grasp enzyme
MKFLIATEPDDTDALFVKIALEKIGHQVRLFFTADHPTKQKNSVFIEKDDYQWKSSDKYNSVLDNSYNVVWWRRVRKPYIPKELSHPNDYKFVLRENGLFFESLTYNMAPQAWWVNLKEAADRSKSKLLQLKVANHCGLSIPTTLCSNDPKDIRNFLLKFEKEGVIYKPLCSNFWFEESQIKITYTTKISFLDLPRNQALQLVPGIFQKEIKKKYELRIVCFGEYLVAVKLNSQNHSQGKIDWRAIPENEMPIEPYTLPSELTKKIKRFMHRMGLVFGSLDFVVTPDDQYVFLEVNEQGQFLWIEKYNPEFKMLDIFINFLLKKSVKFSWNPHRAEHTIRCYASEVSDLLSQNLTRHVFLNGASTRSA